MARIAGIELPQEQRIDFALTRLYGVGWVLSEKILKDAGVDASKRTKELAEQEINAITKALKNYPIEGDLRRRIREDIQRLKDISSYKGIRHNRGLPVRGQRTKTNARTKRGKRRTVGAFKKEAFAKMTTAKPKEG